MAALERAHGHAGPALTPPSGRALARAEFFQTVRLILAATGRGVGDDTRADAEPVRFRVMDGMRHPDTEIVALDRPAEDGPVEMTVAPMGLTGPMGVMPDHYSDLVVGQRRARDEALARFLDLFNHRAISLFYRAWAKYRLPVQFEEDGGAFTDPFSQALAALAGIARLDAPDTLAAAGSLARRVRSPGALRRIVAAMFTMPVEVIELQSRWIRIDRAEQTRLGSAYQPRGNYAGLGLNAVLGETVPDVTGRFRIRIGPLDWPSFQAFFEADGLHKRLTEAVRFAIGGTVDFDIQLVLQADEVPQVQLAESSAPMLSRTGWLLAGPAKKDRDDAVLPATSRAGSGIR
ncbi:type VI secretion system baseplate subunit TssG [Sphingomonas sp. ASY06-1R]|uniref:type VI secretion system baseplate subunit TssG n=1 Tax=Sphingomonas sp. ASY06-1R TaxID=3445771 RepID=UPI003FA2511A